MTRIDVFSEILAGVKPLSARFVDADVRFWVIMDNLEMSVHVVTSGERGGAAIVGAVHGDAGQVVELDVPDDEGRLDVLQTLWALGVVTIGLNLESTNFNNLTFFARG